MPPQSLSVHYVCPLNYIFFLYNVFCTVNTQHILRQDAIITIRLYILLYLNIALNWPEDGRLRPKHVAKYNLIVIIASCLNVCCVLTVQNILYKFD